MAEEHVKLVCKDGEVVEVERSVAEQSTLVKGLIDDGDIEEEIPLANTKKATLDKAIGNGPPPALKPSVPLANQEEGPCAQWA